VCYAHWSACRAGGVGGVCTGVPSGACLSREPHVLLALQFPQYPSPWAAYTALRTDYLMGCPARRIARWLAAAGAATFLYSFTHEPVTQLIVRVPRRRAPTRTLCVLCVVCRGFCVLCWVLPV
jgi:hypothetical protein